MNEQEKFNTGAVRSKGVAGDKEGREARFDLITPVGLRRVAEAYGEGAGKYGDNTWQKGIPNKNLLNHALAHLNQFASGDVSEDHLGHAAWNLFTLMHFQENNNPAESPGVVEELDDVDSELLQQARKMLREMPHDEVKIIDKHILSGFESKPDIKIKVVPKLVPLVDMDVKPTDRELDKVEAFYKEDVEAAELRVKEKQIECAEKGVYPSTSGDVERVKEELDKLRMTISERRKKRLMRKLKNSGS